MQVKLPSKSSLVCVALAVGFGSTASADSLLIEVDTHRFGGTYALVRADSAERCAQLCGLDGQCMAWSWSSAAPETESCEFKSRLGRSQSRPGWYSGTPLSAAPLAAAVDTPTPTQRGAELRTSHTLLDPFSQPYRSVSEGVELAELLGGPEASAVPAASARRRPVPRPAATVQQTYRPRQVQEWSISTNSASPRPSSTQQQTSPQGPNSSQGQGATLSSQSGDFTEAAE